MQVPRTTYPAERVQQLFDLTGERWTMPVLMALRGRCLRFGELRRLVGRVSQKQLTHTLRNLERDGFVHRTHYVTIPPRVDYELTDIGGDLVARLAAVGRFAVENAASIDMARQRFEQAAAGPLPARR